MHNLSFGLALVALSVAGLCGFIYVDSGPRSSISRKLLWTYLATSSTVSGAFIALGSGEWGTANQDAAPFNLVEIPYMAIVLPINMILAGACSKLIRTWFRKYASRDGVENSYIAMCIEYGVRNRIMPAPCIVFTTFSSDMLFYSGPSLLSFFGASFSGALVADALLMVHRFRSKSYGNNLLEMSEFLEFLTEQNGKNEGGGFGKRRIGLSPSGASSAFHGSPPDSAEKLPI